MTLARSFPGQTSLIDKWIEFIDRVRGGSARRVDIQVMNAFFDSIGMTMNLVVIVMRSQLREKWYQCRGSDVVQPGSSLLRLLKPNQQLVCQTTPVGRYNIALGIESFSHVSGAVGK